MLCPQRCEFHDTSGFRLTTLGGMQASDELSDTQARQMAFDLESAYNDFNRFLHNM